MNNYSNEDVAILRDNEKDNNSNNLAADKREKILNNIYIIEDFGAIKLEMENWYVYANKIYRDNHGRIE